MKSEFSAIACLVSLGSVILFFIGGTAVGGFVAIEDFESLTLGPIGGQNDWVAPSSSIVTTDPDGGSDQVLAVTGANTVVRKNMLLEHGQTRMLFLRFRFDEQLNGSFGMSHQAGADQHGDFGPELNLTNASTDLRVANGPTTDATLTTLATGNWYNLWVLVDNMEDDVQVWLNATPGAGATAADKLSNAGIEEFDFRSSTTSDLIRFYIKTGSGGPDEFGPLYFDDIYLETMDAVNLSNPVPEPSVLCLLLTGIVTLAWRARP